MGSPVRAARPRARRPGGQRPRLLASVRGTVIHSLLEDDVAEDLALARRRWEALARAEGATGDEIERGYEALVTHLSRTVADPKLQRVLAASGYSELSFRLPLGSVVVRGQIDRLYLDPDTREWVVLDYKSEAISGPLEQAAEAHRSQLLAYAWAASEVLQGHGETPVRRVEVYFTAAGELVALPRLSDDDLAGFRTLLLAADAAGQRSWEAAEAAATAPGSTRPCAHCGFYRRGCRGQPSQ